MANELSKKNRQHIARCMMKNGERERDESVEWVDNNTDFITLHFIIQQTMAVDQMHKISSLVQSESTF